MRHVMSDLLILWPQYVTPSQQLCSDKT